MGVLKYVNYDEIDCEYSYIKTNIKYIFKVKNRILIIINSKIKR